MGQVQGIAGKAPVAKQEADIAQRVSEMMDSGANESAAAVEVADEYVRRAQRQARAKSRAEASALRRKDRRLRWIEPKKRRRGATGEGTSSGDAWLPPPMEDVLYEPLG